MTIRGQMWQETDTHIVIKIHEAWYGAWKRFGWPEGTKGFGVSVEAIHKAKELGKKLEIRLLKYPAVYEITTDKAIEQGQSNIFNARDQKPLYILPETALTKLEEK